MRAPDGTSAGMETDAFVHIVDLFSTTIELAGGTPPQDRLLDSLSLVPIVEDPTVSMRQFGYNAASLGEVARDSRFKLIRTPTEDTIYDLDGDPFEQAPLLPGFLDDVQQAAYNVLSAQIFGASFPAGRVPDGRFVSGSPLTIGKAPGGVIELSWSHSCGSTDLDYGVYEGILGEFDSHLPVECDTGLPSTTLEPAHDAAYYLVVPTNGLLDGSYGTSSRGVPRFPGPGACQPQAHAGCD